MPPRRPNAPKVPKTSKPQKPPRVTAPRFGIGEWYGRDLNRISADERQRLAEIALGSSTARTPDCPFKFGESIQRCTKKGGVCTLRLYAKSDSGDATPVAGPGGDLRCVCPHRFKQGNTVITTVGLTVLGSATPRVVNEVRFLQRLPASDEPIGSAELAGTAAAEDAAKEDVGNIDTVLVHETKDEVWCALEFQAVYFSGPGMPSLFTQIRDHSGSGMPFPNAVRRPDYRSSAPKRLMPQLQIKVPTLSRWGKKMAVVVDAGFFRSLGNIITVKDISNCDIAWFVVTYDETTDPISIRIDAPKFQTLDAAVKSLTGGTPVTQKEFEAKIREKIGAPSPTTPTQGPGQ